jgi:iron complex transport system substrate-binding protein
MKKKTKIVTMAEIAIVLCSVFLVALPGIAAEQNQEMQKISASEITTASEGDYVLGVYGNANEDDTIDMRDLTYVKLIFFGKKPETELADAKYDGKINPLDFIQIKLIIVGKEKEITFKSASETYKDIPSEAITIRKPVKRIVIAGFESAEVLRALNAADKVVGVGTGRVAGNIKEEGLFFLYWKLLAL